MDAWTRRDIKSDLRDRVEADGYNAEEVCRELAAEYEVSLEDVRVIWQEMNPRV